MPGNAEIRAADLAGILLLFARVAAWVAFVPLPGIARAPSRIRAALAVTLTVALLPAAIPPDEGQDLLATAAREALWGLVFGVATTLLLEACQVGAQIAGLQAGFSFASTIDPASQADSTVINVWMMLLMATAVCATGVDRELLRLMGGSLAATRLPLDAAALVQLGGKLFRAGVAIALPITAALLVVDLALGLVSRYQPALPLLSLAFPLKMLGSLLLLEALTPSLLRWFAEASQLAWAALRGSAAP